MLILKSNICGKKPSCLGWSQGCKDKQRMYYQCTAESNGKMIDAQDPTKDDAEISKNKMIIIASVSVVALIVLMLTFVLLKRK